MLTSPACYRPATALLGQLHEWKLLSCPTPPWDGISHVPRYGWRRRSLTLDVCYLFDNLQVDEVEAIQFLFDIVSCCYVRWLIAT